MRSDYARSVPMNHNNNKTDLRPWIALAASMGLNLTMGSSYSWSIINKSLVTDLHWTSVQASFPYTLYTIFFAATMFFAGRMQDRMGPRKIATAGGVVLGGALAACYFLTDRPLALAVAYGVFGLGNALCFSVTIPASVKWFAPERRGLITGLVIGVVGLAAVYCSPLTNWLLRVEGVANTFLVLGVASFCILLAVSQFMANPPPDYRVAPARGLAASAVVPRGGDVGWPDILKYAAFRKLWVMFFLSTSAGLMILTHMAAIAKKQAHWEDGFYLVIMFSIFNMGGRMISGFLSDIYGRMNILLIVLCMNAINTILFLVYQDPLSLCWGAAMTGLCYGTYFSLYPLITADFFGMRNFGGNYGFLFTAWGTAGLLGPLLGGWAIDVMGSYVIAYAVSAALLCGAIVLTVSMRGHRLSV